MSSFTPRLSLKRNDGADPFLRQDFTDNWNKIDDAPGTYVCTSTTRPNSWGAAQAGRDIIETDTYRRLTWSGSDWIEPRVATGQWLSVLTPGAYANANTTVTYTLGVVTAPRPMFLSLLGNYRLATRPYLYITAYCSILVDDVDVTKGQTGNGSWADQQTTATQLDDKMFTLFGETPVSAGNHTIKARIRVGNQSSNNIYIASMSALSLATAPGLGANPPYLS